MDVSWAGWLLKYLFLEARHVYDECFSGDIKCNGKTKFEPCCKSPICARIFIIYRYKEGELLSWCREKKVHLLYLRHG